MPVFSISGKVIRKSDSQPISGLYAEAWDKNSISKEKLGSGITDYNGIFTLYFDESSLAELYKEDYPELYFKIFSGQTVLANTENDIVVNLGSNQRTVIIPVEYTAVKERKPINRKYQVKGVILEKNYRPAVKYRVEVLDKGLIKDLSLATATVDESGRFEASFAAEAFASTGKITPDIFLKIASDKDEITTTDVHYNAPSILEIKYVIGGASFPRESEFELLSKKLQPLLRNTSANDIRFSQERNPFALLSEKTGEQPQKLKWFVTSHQLSAHTSLPPEFYYALLSSRLSTDETLHFREILGKDLESIIMLLKNFSEKNEVTDVFSLSQDNDAILKSLINHSDASIPRAIDYAVKNNIVPANIQAKRSELDRQWEELKKKYSEKERAEFDRLLGTTRLKTAEKKVIGELYEKHGRNLSDIITELEKNNSVKEEGLNELRVLNGLTALVKEPALAAEIKSGLNISHPDDLRKLAKLPEDEWKKILGAKTTESQVNAIMLQLEREFPTAAFAGKLERDGSSNLPSKNSMLKFFDANPHAELHKTNFDLFFHKNEKSISKDLENAGELRQELKKFQRIFKLVPSYEKVKTLLNKNIHSSQGIYALGEKRFVEQVTGDVISKEEAKVIYKKAERTYAASLAIWGDIKSMEQGSVMSALPDIRNTYNNLKHSTMKDFPDWKTLFTSPDICECKECRSVYSAAAYLTDVLKFLNKRGSTTPLTSAKAILFKRRPDLGEIDLDCDNTNIPIPYIDLVCETLEEALAGVSTLVPVTLEPLFQEGIIHTNVYNEFRSKGLEIAKDAILTIGPGVTPATWYVRDKQHTYKIEKKAGQLRVNEIRQTHGTAAERKAMPEYINYPAYENNLKSALHPLTLPFDLAWEESRAYLEKIEINRHHWMQEFRHIPTLSPSDAEIAREYFCLSPKEKDIIVTPNVAAQNQFWGGLTDIDKVSVFLYKSELKYTQLEDLLSLKFINPAFDAKIVHEDTTCNTEQKHISNLSTTRLDRINRFLRFWRKLGWEMWEVDMVLMNPKIGNNFLDDNFLIHLQQFDDLRKMLNLKVEELIAYYENLNSTGKTPIYNKLFRNKVILDPLPEAFKPEMVTENPFPNPAPPERTVAGQLTSLSAVLKLKDEEALAIQANSLSNDDLSLENISIFYRVASLTRKQKISAGDYYLLLKILNTGGTFDVFASVKNTKDFIGLLKLVKSSRLSIAELAYLLLHEDHGSKPLIATDEKIADFLKKVREALQKVKDELHAVTGLPDEIAKTLIGKIAGIDEEAANMTVQVFNGSFKGTIAARDAFLDNIYGPVITPANTAILKTKLNDRDAAAPSLKDEKTREAYEKLNEFLIAYLQSNGSRQVIIQLHVPQFKLADDICETFLSKIQLQGTAISLIEQWFVASLLAKDPAGNYINDLTPANFPELYDSFRLLDKIALLQLKLPVNISLAELLISNANDFAIIAYNDLPVSLPVTNSNFYKWKSYAELTQFQTLYPDNDAGSLAQVMKLALPMAATEVDFLQALAAYTGWEITELIGLKTQLGLTFSADYRNVSTWHQLDRSMNLLITPSIKASQIPLVINTAPLSADAIAIKQLVKSKYDNVQWLNTSANIQASSEERKGLREKKRDALIAYFTHHTVNGLSFKDANELYSYYLLDVEMGSCEVTTRILQAGLSAQLFVQRCLMNLEQEVIANENEDSGWKEWDWMKNYRVWEANRKVFLYPENWIEPELRLDKSYFFQELENDLMQNEITQPNVENAYLTYLEKLDNVARLDVCGYYYDDQTYTLHVFGRTYDDPHIYYYRRWVDDMYWTPWEKLDLEINATHVVPVVINRRLYLYWPDFRERSVDPVSTNTPEINQSSFPIDKPNKYWEIRLAVSEYRNKKWTPKKISKSFITTAASKNPAPKEQFSFIPLDMLDICDKYLIGCFGNTSPTNQSDYGTYVLDYFELGGCHGTPEVLSEADVWGLLKTPIVPQFEWTELSYLESQEQIFYPTDILAYQQGNLFINHQPILMKTPGAFRAPVPAQFGFFDKILIWLYYIIMQIMVKNKQISPREWPFPYTLGTLLPFFYEDKKRTFFVLQQIILMERGKRDPANADSPDIKMAELFYSDILKIFEEILRTGQLPDIIKPFFENGKKPMLAYKVKFNNFYHPYVCFLIKQLYKHGLDGMMKREVQLLDKTKYPELTEFSFKNTYQPTPLVNPGQPVPGNPFPYYPKENIDFTPSGSYSGYNWELFFHAPLMLAVKLSRNQRFEEAQHWFHYIFNPTDTSAYSSPQKFWITKPFFERTNQGYIDERIDNILTMINSGDTGLIKQVDLWRKNAFQPHLIAQFRTVAYQKTVVMKYLDNLVDWADNLFRSDRREAIGEATQLYILAAQILGPKPRIIPKTIEAPTLNYNQLEPKLDAFANAMVNVENLIPFFESAIDDIDIPAPLPAIETFYYCIPQNDKFLEYWDKIADRLFKIRHCMNFDGIERQLALFDPPIDPGLLVKAAASGMSFGAVVAGLSAPLPVYRFQTMMQKASELCNEVKALGGALLSALEKKDAEAISLLRSTHEIRVLELVREVKKQQIDEAKGNIEALNKTRAVTEEKKKYYGQLSYMNAAEIVAFALSGASTLLDVAIAAGYLLMGGLKAVPQFVIGAAGFGGSPEASAEIGGQQFGDVADAAVKTISSVSHALDKGASLASTQGSYMRRQEEWDFQKELAIKEIEQIDKQIIVAEIRLAIAEKELSNQETQIDQAKEAKAFMENKFTNKELYDWMVGQISGVYFQSYQLAYDMAKKAERCYRFELGLSDSSFIQFGYWDSLRKGLLSGEKLSLDLRRLESSFFDQHKREFEITKHISLAQIDPLALLQLKQNGECFINIPEEIFDLDYPGHYFRRIKTVSVSIPCIIGSYGNVNCTLTILKSRTRVSPLAANVDYSTPPTESDPGFSFNFSSIQQIVTSNGQNDAGMFDVNLRDERYLTFEGHGAVSEWKVEINKDFKNFDTETINDVILHMRFTARQGGKLLASKVKTELTNNFDQIIKTYDPGNTGFYKMISMKSDFPTELHRLLHAAGPAHQVDMAVSASHVPYWLSGKTLEWDSSTNMQQVYIKLKKGQTINVNTVNLQLNGQAVDYTPPTNLGELKKGITTQSGDFLGNWNIDLNLPPADYNKIDDIVMVTKYKIV